MTTTFGTTADGNDLYLGNNGNIVVLSGQDAVKAACETATKAQLGEMVLATGLGIPNFQAVWVGSPNLARFENALRTTISNVIGVLEVTALTISTANNTLSYQATISTEFGKVDLNG